MDDFKLTVRKGASLSNNYRIYFYTFENRKGERRFGVEATVSFSDRYKQFCAHWGSCSQDMKGMELQYKVIGSAMKKARQLNKIYGF